MTLYGLDNPVKIEEVLEKTKQTNIKRYGVEYTFQSKEIRSKGIDTMVNLHGFEYAMQSPELKEKAKNTLRKRYGVEYTWHIDGVVEKSRKSMYERGNAPSSRQQRYICNLYGGELNFPHHTSSLDIAFPSEMIYIECDFGGHNLSVKLGTETKEENIKREKRRYYALYRRGWKEIRIISSKDLVPLDEKLMVLLHLSNKTFHEGQSWIHFDIDNSKVKYNGSELNYDYGELRKINQDSLDKQFKTT